MSDTYRLDSRHKGLLLYMRVATMLHKFVSHNTLAYIRGLYNPTVVNIAYTVFGASKRIILCSHNYNYFMLAYSTPVYILYEKTLTVLYTKKHLQGGLAAKQRTKNNERESYNFVHRTHEQWNYTR